MARFITMSLLLVVFFFGGMSYGSFEKDRLPIQPSAEVQEIETEETIRQVEAIDSERLQLNEKEPVVHKTASFFEKVVTSIYELVIQVMYQIAEMFFD